MALVSIIYTCHNQISYFLESIQVICKHINFKHTEIILVNSSDEDAPLLAGVTEYKIKNNGPSYARNYGIEKANGEYIMFCDADDIVNPYCITDAKSIFNENADAVFFDFEKANEEEIISKATGYYDTVKSRLKGYSITPVSDPVVFLQKFFPVHAALFRRSALEHCRFNVAQWFIEDVRFYLELKIRYNKNLFYCGDMKYVSFHRYYKNKKSLSTSNEMKFWEGVCSNFNFIWQNATLSKSSKLQLLMLSILNYHSVRLEMRTYLLKWNREIWNYAFRMGHLLRNQKLFTGVRWLTRKMR